MKKDDSKRIQDAKRAIRRSQGKKPSKAMEDLLRPVMQQAYPETFARRMREIRSQCDDSGAKTAIELLETVPAAESREEMSDKGVTMIDAALVLSQGHAKVANETKERWLRQSKHPRPPSIGVDPKHSQRPMFRPTELIKFIEAVDGELIFAESALVEKLLRGARKTCPKPMRIETGQDRQ